MATGRLAGDRTHEHGRPRGHPLRCRWIPLNSANHRGLLPTGDARCADRTDPGGKPRLAAVIPLAGAMRSRIANLQQNLGLAFLDEGPASQRGNSRSFPKPSNTAHRNTFSRLFDAEFRNLMDANNSRLPADAPRGEKRQRIGPNRGRGPVHRFA